MTTRHELELWIEHLIDLLNQIDGDAEMEVEEPEQALCPAMLDYERRPVRYVKSVRRVA